MPAETLPRILLLEDEIDHVRLIKEIFKGYATIDVARNSSEFFPQLDTGDPVCLCLLDNQIAGDPNFKDSEVGIRILEMLKDYEESKVPVIFISGEPLNKDDRAFVEERSKIYPKPFNSIDELFQLGKEFIEEFLLTFTSPLFTQFIITSWLDEPRDDFELGDTVFVLRINRIIDQLTVTRSMMRNYWTPIRLAINHDQVSINIQGQGIVPTENSQLQIQIPPNEEPFSEIRIGLSVLIDNYHSNSRTLDVQLFDDAEFKDSIRMNVTIDTEILLNASLPKIKGRLIASNRLIDPSRREEPILTLNWRDTKTKPIGTLIASRLMRAEIDNLSLRDFESIKKRLLNALREVERRVDSTPTENDRMALDRIQPLITAGDIAFKHIFQSFELRTGIGRIMHMARVRGRLPIIRIITDDEHLIPWDLVYARYLDWHDDAERIINQFWGMGCIVEHMLPGSDAVDDVRINNPEKTHIAMVRNQSVVHPLEHEMTLMSKAEDLGRLVLSERNHKGSDIELKKYLEQPTNIIQLVGHGVPDEESPLLDQLDFGDGVITPLWLNDWNVKFQGQPFVIINACQSLNAIPDLYGSFLRAFLDCGARGILGTLVPIKAIFASRFTTNFYEDFLNGKSAGESLYFARWNCWDKSKSLLGLLYTYYGSLYIHLQRSTRAQKLDVCSVCLAGKSCSALMAQ